MMVDGDSVNELGGLAQTGHVSQSLVQEGGMVIL